MAHLKIPKAPVQVKRIGLADLRKEYNDLATEYNKFLDQKYLFCHMCGDFLAADSGFYTDNRFATGKFCLCKRCVMKLVEQRDNKNDEPNETKESVQNMLKLMDLPYIDSFYEDCCKGAWDEVKEKNRSSPFATYNTAVRSLPQWKGLKWKDSEFGATNYESEQLTKRQPRKEIIKLFGGGFGNEDYLYLQDQYDDWCSRTQVDSKSQQTYVIQICMQLLDIYKDRRSNKDVTKKLEALDKLMNAANLQPKQNVNNAATDSLTFGQLIEKWEEEKPIPEPSEEFKDVDGIGKYIRVWFTGWLCKAFGLKANVFTEEYDEEISKYTVNKPDELEDESTSDTYERLFGNEGGDS